MIAAHISYSEVTKVSAAANCLGDVNWLTITVFQNYGAGLSTIVLFGEPATFAPLLVNITMLDALRELLAVTPAVAPGAAQIDGIEKQHANAIAAARAAIAQAEVQS